MSNKRQLKFIFEDYELKLRIIMSFEEKLIFKVQKYPVLYQKSAGGYKKKTNICQCHFNAAKLLFIVFDKYFLYRWLRSAYVFCVDSVRAITRKGLFKKFIFSQKRLINRTVVTIRCNI